MGLIGNVPVRKGLGQFGLPTFALVEKANSGIGAVPIGPNQQLFEGGKGAGSDHVGPGRRNSFDPPDDNPGLLLEAHPAGSFTQKGGLAGIRFNQHHV
jgi:hypothetical protein